MSPEKRKPVLAGTGLLKIEALAGNFDKQEDTPNPRELQVHRLRCRWPNLSLPLEHVRFNPVHIQQL